MGKNDDLWTALSVIMVLVVVIILAKKGYFTGLANALKGNQGTLPGYGTGTGTGTTGGTTPSSSSSGSGGGSSSSSSSGPGPTSPSGQPLCLQGDTACYARAKGSSSAGSNIHPLSHIIPGL